MSKSNSLEGLLSSYDKAEKVRLETEALKPRLENELNAALATGDVLDEKLAAGLQVKRGQLELIPYKIHQIETRMLDLKAEIDREYEVRFSRFYDEIGEVSNLEKIRIENVIKPLIPELVTPSCDAVINQILSLTKLSAQLGTLRDFAKFQKHLGNPVGAARNLISAEKDLVVIKANLAKS